MLDHLDPLDVRCLRDTKNYAARDYFSIDPGVLVEAVVLRIPQLLRRAAERI
ncbi:hypothetical protein [Leucobacter sp. wl10]|uniref:hypothetical protein n=1 Tax=Leucobacter sp. wl10 TaxID=2304677 RepID=UPI0013C2DF66|nr:hypothetical protein [Leucobacter sp. wl10]